MTLPVALRRAFLPASVLLVSCGSSPGPGAAPNRDEKGAASMEEHPSPRAKPVRIYVYDPLLSIPQERRDAFAQEDPFLRSGRALVAHLEQRYGDSIDVAAVHWPVEASSEILSTNPEDYRDGTELRDRAVHLKIKGSMGPVPGVDRPRGGYGKIIASGDPQVLGATRLELNSPADGDVRCPDDACASPQDLVRSVQGRIDRIIRGI